MQLRHFSQAGNAANALIIFTVIDVSRARILPRLVSHAVNQAADENLGVCQALLEDAVTDCSTHQLSSICRTVMPSTHCKIFENMTSSQVTGVQEPWAIASTCSAIVSNPPSFLHAPPWVETPPATRLLLRQHAPRCLNSRRQAALDMVLAQKVNQGSKSSTTPPNSLTNVTQFANTSTTSSVSGVSSTTMSTTTAPVAGTNFTAFGNFTACNTTGNVTSIDCSDRGDAYEYIYVPSDNSDPYYNYGDSALAG